MTQTLNFTNLPALVAAVSTHQQFQHQIKGKRIKKQLTNLEEYNNNHLTFKNYQISSSGISFFIQTLHQHRLYDFEILIDFQYPFNRPKVLYINPNSSYAYGQDLLDSILNEDNWGPSMLLSSIFDKLNLLAKFLSQQSDKLKPKYFINDIYEWELLNKYKVELFNVEEYIWKYMIKTTSQKVLGLTKEYLLKFSANGNKLKLEKMMKIKDIKEVNADILHAKFKLDIVSNSSTDKNKYYFGGEQQDIQPILYFMNPIQVIQRKLNKSQKQNYESEELQLIIKQYSELIEFYSLRDQQKSKKYINAVQSLIKKSYEQQLNGEKQPQFINNKQNIKT